MKKAKRLISIISAAALALGLFAATPIVSYAIMGDSINDPVQVSPSRSYPGGANVLNDRGEEYISFKMSTDGYANWYFTNYADYYMEFTIYSGNRTKLFTMVLDSDRTNKNSGQETTFELPLGAGTYYGLIKADTNYYDYDDVINFHYTVNEVAINNLKAASGEIQPLTFGSTITGFFGYESNDRDHTYSLKVTNPGTYTFNFTSYTSPYSARLYYGNGAQILFDIASANGTSKNPKSTSKSANLSAGTYYLDIERGNSNDFYDYGRYSFVVNQPNATPAPTPTPSTGNIAIYRLYNPNTGEHFYTKNAAERQQNIIAGWKDENIGWYAPSTSNSPVYRLYNPNAGDHHYTSNLAEKNMLVAVGWRYEDIAFYSADAKTVPIYRSYNPNAKKAGAHNYTTKIGEYNSLTAAGWTPEGPGFYAAAAGQ